VERLLNLVAVGVAGIIGPRQIDLTAGDEGRRQARWCCGDRGSGASCYIGVSRVSGGVVGTDPEVVELIGRQVGGRVAAAAAAAGAARRSADPVRRLLNLVAVVVGGVIGPRQIDLTAGDHVRRQARRRGGDRSRNAGGDIGVGGVSG